MWPQRHISEVIESHNDRKTTPQICVYTKKSINSSEQRRTQPWIELVVRYLLDSVHSIRVMNDGIYEAQTRPIILQHNNNIQCSPSGPKAAAAKKKKKEDICDFLFLPASPCSQSTSVHFSMRTKQPREYLPHW